MIWFNCVVAASEGAVKQKLVEFVNNDRYARGLQPICDQTNLDSAAAHHSNEMAAQAIMQHESPSFKTPWVRMKSAGYNGFSRSENILKTPMSDSDDTAFAKHLYMLWKTSPDHWKNIIDPSVNRMGFSFAQSARDRFTYATQNFGVGGQSCTSPVKFNPFKRVFNQVSLPVKNAWNWLTGKKSADQIEKEKFARLKEDKDSSIRRKKEKLAWLNKLALLKKKKDKDSADKKAAEEARQTEDAKQDESAQPTSTLDNDPKSHDLKPFFGAADLNAISDELSGNGSSVTSDDDFFNHLQEMNQQVLALGSKTLDATSTEEATAAATATFPEYLDTLAEDMNHFGLLRSTNSPTPSVNNIRNKSTFANDAISPIGETMNNTTSPFHNSHANATLPDDLVPQSDDLNTNL